MIGSKGNGKSGVPTPAYIFRGHASAIHSLCFFWNNTRLLAGDADGYIVVWDLVTRRPTAVWHAHELAILGAKVLPDNTIITQGRDYKIRVWKFSASDEQNGEYSTALPVESHIATRKEPWLLHSLTVETLNFCSFSYCIQAPKESEKAKEDAEPQENQTSSSNIYLAVVGNKDSEIDIYQLPNERKVSTINAPSHANGKAGMVMALRIILDQQQQMLIVAGYENGSTCVFKSALGFRNWDELYINTAHSQPILSLDYTPELSAYFTSSADALLVRNPLVATEESETEEKQTNTKHSGQQSLEVRSDGKIFATAGWDSKARVYSVKTMRELAVLKWHKEGCNAVAFANISPQAQEMANSPEAKATTAEVERFQSSTAKSRYLQASNTHWLAVGSKDGKISLWDIY